MPLSNKIAKRTFTIAALILLGLSYTLYVQIKDLDDSYDKVNQTNVVKLKLEQTLSTLKDAETAQRGFLLTQDSLFLEPYQGAAQKLDILMMDIRNLTHNNAEQQKNLNALKTFIDVRFRAFATQISQYNTPDISRETRKQHLMNSKASMDSMRLFIQSISRSEERLLGQREAKKKTHRILTPLLAFLLILTTLTILVFSYGKIIEQLNKTRKLLDELRNLNNKLKQKNHELELYNKELDSFTYIASHDLKEPLRKILTFSSLLQESEANQLNEKSRENLQKILHAARRMQNLLNDLLLYSHTSQANKEFEEVNLNKIIEDVQLNLKEELEESRTVIRIQKLPLVMGLSFQLRQLFENLIVNSIKYRQKNLPPEINITCNLVARDDIPNQQFKQSSFYYQITYADNGLGFPQAHAEKVFELFRRMHPDEPHKGTGIGLTICKKIVQNHNGFIAAKSEVNRGTVFEIFIPYQEISIYRTKETQLSM